MRNKDSPESAERKARARAKARARRRETLLYVAAATFAMLAYLTHKFGGSLLLVGCLAAPAVPLFFLARIFRADEPASQAPQGSWRDRETISEKPSGWFKVFHAIDKIRRPWKSGPPPGGW